MDSATSNPPRDLGGFLFRWRGWIFVPLALFVLWIGRPTPATFIIGLLVALLGEGLRIWGVGYAGTTTRGNAVIAPELVTDGPFAHVRNPLYLGNIISALGICFIAVGAMPLAWSLPVLVLTAALYLGVYRLIIGHEERFLAATFGQPYELYCEMVPRLLPRLLSGRQSPGVFKWKAISRGEIQTLVMLTLILVFLAAKMIWS